MIVAIFLVGTIVGSIIITYVIDRAERNALCLDERIDNLVVRERVVLSQLSENLKGIDRLAAKIRKQVDEYAKNTKLANEGVQSTEDRSNQA